MTGGRLPRSAPRILPTSIRTREGRAFALSITIQRDSKHKIKKCFKNFAFTRYCSKNKNVHFSYYILHDSRLMMYMKESIKKRFYFIELYLYHLSTIQKKVYAIKLNNFCFTHSFKSVTSTEPPDSPSPN